MLKQIKATPNCLPSLCVFLLSSSGFDAKDDDSNNDRLLRPLIIAILGRAGNADVLAKARAAFERHYAAVTAAPDGQAPDQEKLISADMRTCIYAMCLRNGGDKEFQQMLTVSCTGPYCT